MTQRGSTSFEIVGGKLNHALVFEAVQFDASPIAVDSAQLLLTGAKLQTRWDLVRSDHNKKTAMEPCES